MKEYNNNPTELKYIPSLDGIRAIAAIMVVLFHSPIPMFQLQFGWAGVNLFFILSGFLITRILLHTRKQSFQTYARNFYLRRALRIFPLYYLYLTLIGIVLYILASTTFGQFVEVQQGFSDLNRNYLFLLTYTYNFQQIINFWQGESYNSSMFFGHLWTLSVEEQFYLLLPVAVYFLPIRYLKKVLVFLIIAMPFFRLIFVLAMKDRVNDLFWIGEVLYSNSFFQLDSLSLGACLALFNLEPLRKNSLRCIVIIIALFIATGIAHLLIFKHYGIYMPLSTLGYDNPVYHLLTKAPYFLLENRYLYTIPLLNALFGFILMVAITGRIRTKLLENKILVKLGNISYGVYLYHLGCSYFFKIALEGAINLDALHICVQGIFFLAYILFLFGIAWVSYWYFEVKFLKKKRRFA